MAAGRGISFRFSGGKAIERALGELGSKSTMKRTAERALAKAAEPIRDKAQALAPKLTGELENSVQVGKTSDRRSRNRNRDVAEVFVGITGKKAGTPMSPFVAALNEFGGLEMPAQPFMRPAMDVELPQTPDRIAAAIWPEIERSAQRLAKRRAKGG